jgi:hypothetical protein
MQVDHSKFKLGKAKPRHDPRTFQLANYLGPKAAEACPPAPAMRDWTSKVRKPWGMLANDVVGDCTVAGAAHIIQAWTANEGPQEVSFTDAQVIEAYSKITGYNPTDPSTDQGAVLLDVLKYWRKTGISGHKILAFASPEPGNKDHIRAALDLFGGLYIGLDLPVSAQTQRVWSVPPCGRRGPGVPGGWGCHCVVAEAYDPQGLTVITWGEKKRMTWGFFQIYCDEAYAVLSEDWLKDDHRSPSGFDLAALQADLQAIR